MTDPSSRLVGLIAAIVAPLGWGLTGILIRSLDSYDALLIVTGRLLVAFLVLGAILLVRRTQGDASGWRIAVAMSAYYVLATEAFLRAPVVEVTLVVGAAPLVAVLLDLLRGIRPGTLQVAALVVTGVGFALFLAPGTHGASNHGLGDLYALGAAITSALYVIGIKRQVQRGLRPDPVMLATTACGVGALASAVIAVLTGAVATAPVPTPTDILFDLALGSVATALPTLAFGIASSKLPAVVTTSLALLTPVFSGVFAGLALGEWPKPVAVPGILLILAGLVLMLLAPARSPNRGARST
jgi:DME family drug/metabolite transporter